MIQLKMNGDVFELNIRHIIYQYSTNDRLILAMHLEIE